MSDAAAATATPPPRSRACGLVAESTKPNARRLGSKANEATWKTIINQMPPHHTYIEPFLGWGAIMLHKAPAAYSICIDKEEAKVRSFLLELATAHPPLMSGIVEATDVLWENIGQSPLNHVTNDGATAATIALRPKAALIVGDALQFLASYPWRGDELVYLDPPYMHETRSSRHRYLFDMENLEHTALLDMVLKIPANVMLSGYFSKMYAERLATWRLVTFEAATRGGMRTEHLWCNFPEPVALHDYRCLGKNHRERQDLNRMRKRWIAKLEKMPILKQRALFAAIKEFQDGRD